MGAEQLPPGAFGRLQREVRVAEELGQKRIVDATARGERSARVEATHATAESPDGMVHQRISRAGIKGQHGLPLPARRHPGHVADPADVLHRPAELPIAEQQRIAPRGQRRALAAGGNIAVPKIGDRGHSEAFGDHRRLAQLQRGPGMAGLDLVPDGLTVRRHQLGLSTGLPQGQRGRTRERLTDEHVELAHLVDPALLRIEQFVDALAQLLVDRRLGIRQQPHPQVIVLVRYVNHRRVDTVDGRARHQPDHDHVAMARRVETTPAPAARPRRCDRPRMSWQTALAGSARPCP